MDNTAEIEALTAEIESLAKRIRDLSDRRLALGYGNRKERAEAKKRATKAAYDARQIAFLEAHTAGMSFDEMRFLHGGKRPLSDTAIMNRIESGRSYALECMPDHPLSAEARQKEAERIRLHREKMTTYYDNTPSPS